MSARLALGSELVSCRAHGVQRLAKLCIPSPIYNADRQVVGYSYTCNPSAVCSSAKDRQPWAKQEDAAAVPNSVISAQSTSSRPCEDALEKLETSGARMERNAGASIQSTVPRSAARYYDMATNNRMDARPKKVCWSCGMENHEKPQCRNQLCKRCHGLATNDNGSYHICAEIPLSPFVVLSPLTSEELQYARCPTCLQYGHLDCHNPVIPKDRVVCCCHCGEAGHHGFDCPQQQYPDRWVQCVMAAGRAQGVLYSSFQGPERNVSDNRSEGRWAVQQESRTTRYEDRGRRRERDEDDSYPQYERPQRNDNYQRATIGYQERRYTNTSQQNQWRETSSDFSSRRQQDFDTSRNSWTQSQYQQRRYESGMNVQSVPNREQPRRYDNQRRPRGRRGDDNDSDDAIQF